MAYRRSTLLVITSLLVILLTACGQRVNGTAQSIYDDPYRVAGLAPVGGKSGARPNVADADMRIYNTDHGEVDRLVGNALEDIQAYWRNEFRTLTNQPFRPIGRIVSWDSRETETVKFCGRDTNGVVNATYCGSENSIGWDRGVLLPEIIATWGEMAVVLVVAHEYGHSIQFQAKSARQTDPGIVFEQQADCFAGAFLRHMVEGGARHFRLNTADGLTAMLSVIASLRDSDPTDPYAIHGSSFERVTALQIGFADAAAGCPKINLKEIEERRATVSNKFPVVGPTAEPDVTEGSLQALMSALTEVMPAKTPPRLDTSGECDGTDAEREVQYCASANSIAVDINALARRSIPKHPTMAGLYKTVNGDFTASLAVISRYTLAVQAQLGNSIEGVEVGLRSSCLSGAIAAALAEKKRPDVRVTSIDLDEAISSLLTDGLAAQDVDGKAVPSGFSRVEAFRLGILRGIDACNSRYY